MPSSIRCISLRLDDAANPIMMREQVADVPAAFVADPFLLPYRGEWHLFFEVLNHDRKDLRRSAGRAASIWLPGLMAGSC